MNQIGVMQGRLTPPVDGRIQAFPKEDWRQEFDSAKVCGLDLIEWVVDVGDGDWSSNPLIDDPSAILNEMQRTGVSVKSVCADYFMTHRFLRVDHAVRSRHLALLEGLIDKVAAIDARHIVLPFVDASAIYDDSEFPLIVDCLREALDHAKESGIKLLFETSLDPARFKRLLDLAKHDALMVNYDIGNSASLGYNPTDEIGTYGPHIATVHVKDRVLGGTTVALGRGDADFTAVFSALRKQRYQGPFILQVARGRDGQEMEQVKDYTAFVHRHLNQGLL